jgi:hypothetical protein
MFTTEYGWREEPLENSSDIAIRGSLSDRFHPVYSARLPILTPSHQSGIVQLNMPSQQLPHHSHHG